MLPILSLCLVISGALPSPAAAATTRNAQTIQQQTIRTNKDGKTHAATHPVDPGATTVTVLTGNGEPLRLTSGVEKNVIIEMQARPVLDRKSPGSFEKGAAQRKQLARDLAALDKRRGSKKPARIKREFHRLFSGVSATIDAAAIHDIRKLPNVLAVYEDVQVRAQVHESVPLIGAVSVATTYGVNGTGVKVAVIDTGIDYTHPDLGGCLGVACKVVGGYDFVNGDADPHDDNGHGTHVAGIIAANGTVKGVAPGATLLAYKVLDSGGYGFMSDIVAGLEQAVIDGAKVANLSLGGGGNPDDATSQALDNATAAGMLSVVSAGNSGPAYQTIGSPGVARTALTVGATDKSWNMASFSSRGYVPDGENVLMKPEVIAPGVNIRSTVPGSGMHGDPSGYKLLDGTSMAAPHVAGSAALLLHWNAAQTPAQLKNRLVTSARATPADVFSEGAGAIDLVAAFGLRVAASPAHVSFGVVSARSGIITRDQTLTLTNHEAGPVTLTLSNDAALPAGATLEIIPSNVALAAGASATVTVRLHVDGALCPEAPEPLAWSTTIAIAGGAYTTHVPAYFFRASILRLTYDEAPWLIQLIGETDVRTFVLPPTSGVTALLPTGPRDVVALFQSPVAVVVREGVNVEGDVSAHLTRAQTDHLLSIRAVDDAEQPMPEVSFRRDMVLTLDFVPTGPAFGLVMSNLNDVPISGLSSRYVVGLIGGGPDLSSTRYFSPSWVGKGLSGDVSLPLPGVPFRPLVQGGVLPPFATHATIGTAVGFTVRLPGSESASYYGVSEEPLDRTLYLQSNALNATLVPLRKTTLAAWAGPNFTHLIDGPFFMHHGGSTITVNGFPWSNFFINDPDAVLGPDIERWDLDTAPHSLPLRFYNYFSIIGYSRSYSTGWATQTAGNILRTANLDPTFDLYRDGTLAGTYPFDSLRSGISSPPGPHEIRSTSHYTIGGTAGLSNAVVSFTTGNLDPNPPHVSMFRIEQNGIRTPTPFHPAPQAPHVKFRVNEDYEPVTVTLEWRQSGTTTWTPLSLNVTEVYGLGTEFDGVLGMGGSIDLRVTATDPSGNSFREEWLPALITTTLPPPTAPSSMTATRTGSSAISLSWNASSSPIGISSYRIERLPGNVTYDVAGSATSFVDTSVVSGNAYFYRVTAVATDATASTPSAYDVATLVQLDDDPLVAGVTRIRGVHMSQMRRAIDAVRVAAGLTPAWTNYDVATGRVMASHFAELRNRLDEARSVVQLDAISGTQPLESGRTINASDLQAIRAFVK